MMDTKFKIVRDRHEYVIGVLIIGREIKDVDRFRRKYRILRREADIINLIVQGESNPGIAKELGLSMETVKTHIKSVYNKLGLNNRMQLISLLNEYNMIAKIPADRSIAILKWILTASLLHPCSQGTRRRYYRTLNYYNNRGIVRRLYTAIENINRITAYHNC